jgi:DNA recombination protein RmuC
VKLLAEKGYARRVGRSPEMVVMFVASEAAFSAAALADPKLLEDAARERVVIATPATMVALLQAVGLAWREATLSERAERVRELAVELCRRIATFADHLSNSGKGIERAAKAHNEAVGSFEGRILPTARRMAELGVADGASIDAAPVQTQLRDPANGNGYRPSSSGSASPSVRGSGSGESGTDASSSERMSRWATRRYCR